MVPGDPDIPRMLGPRRTVMRSGGNGDTTVTQLTPDLNRERVHPSLRSALEVFAVATAFHGSSGQGCLG